MMPQFNHKVWTDLSQRLTAGFLAAAIAALFWTGTPFFQPSSHVPIQGIQPNPAGAIEIVLDNPSKYGTGYSFDENLITIHTPGQYRLMMSGIGQGFPIQVEAGAGSVTLTLESARINCSDKPALSCQNPLTVLLLSGDSSLTGGILVSAGTQCIVYGPGTLQAQGFPGGAGIGGNDGSIRIESGSVTATGGIGAAGIGGDTGVQGGQMRRIDVAGGTVSATGGPSGGAGIGGGTGVSSGASGGDIFISGGTVTATGSGGGAGIGGALGGDGGSIRISAGTVIATGRGGGAGIGGGSGTNGSGTTGGQIQITGGTIEAKSQMGYGAGIGGGAYGSGGVIEISGGHVNAEGGYALDMRRKRTSQRDATPGGAGIGGGCQGQGADVLIAGEATEVKAEGGNDAYDLGSGTGNGDGGKLRLEGGAILHFPMNGSNAEILQGTKLLLLDGCIHDDSRRLDGCYRHGRKQLSEIALYNLNLVTTNVPCIIKAGLNDSVLSSGSSRLYPLGTIEISLNGQTFSSMKYEPNGDYFYVSWLPRDPGKVTITGVYIPNNELDYFECEEGVVGELEIVVQGMGSEQKELSEEPSKDSPPKPNEEETHSPAENSPTPPPEIEPPSA